MTSAYPQSQALSGGLMLHALARNWWLILLRGVCAILFGVLAFIWPGITLLTLALLYGIFALIEGALALAAAIMGGAPAPRWWLAVVGLLGIAVGILTIIMPGMTAFLLVLFIAAWAIVSGIMQIVGAIRLRKEIDNEWMLVAVGVISVAFGVLVALQPMLGALSLVFVIGAYAIIYGVALVALAFRLRGHSHPAPASAT
ncbi:MAG: hypothetical protein QOD94_366 [Alphaproteobacteria bacterium]|nr:hypothetical protein [Alphaproteobacteria bacterium]